MSEEIKNTTASEHHSTHHSSSSHHHSSSHRHNSSSHHHSSSSRRKSSSKKHSSSEATKGERIGRNVLAFALFLTISLLSLTICVKASFVSPQSIVKIFVNEEYVTALRDDIITYSHDRCTSCMLPENTLDEAITYEDIYNLENAYISGAANASKEFTKTTYEDNAQEIKNKVQAAIDSRIKADGLAVDEKQKDSSKKLTEEINNYILQRLEIAHMDKLETVVNVGKIVSIVGIAALSVLALVLVLILISIGSKRYRALRWVVHSLNAAGLLNLLLVLGVECIKLIKSLVLYPTYIADAFMSYVMRCEQTVLISSAVLFALGLVLTCGIWRMNRNSKE